MDSQAGDKDSGSPAHFSFVEAEPRKGVDLSVKLCGNTFLFNTFHQE